MLFFIYLKVKRSFTLAYNKRGFTTPYTQGMAASRKRGTAAPVALDAEESDIFGAPEGDIEEASGESADEDDIGNDKMIKAKKAPAEKNTAKTGKPTSGRTKGAGSSKGRGKK